MIDNNNCQVIIMTAEQVHIEAVFSCPIDPGSNQSSIEIGWENVISCDFEGGNSWFSTIGIENLLESKGVSDRPWIS